MPKLKAEGLKALIPIKSRTKPKKKKENVYYVEIRKIRQTSKQFKNKIDKKILKELIESIKKYGVVQPLEVAKVEKKKKKGINVYYRLISGQKRLLAAKTVGLRVVPAKIKTNSDSATPFSGGGTFDEQK